MTTNQSKAVNTDNSETKAAQKKSRKGCSENDASYHSYDRRWCGNLYLSGASYSEEITYKESVPVAVDLAYIRAKRHLEFKDPDDQLNTSYNERYEWDGIQGTYYGVKGRFGGPMKQMLYYSDYDLQLEKINGASTKVTIKYRMYGRDNDPNEFKNDLFNKINDKG